MDAQQVSTGPSSSSAQKETDAHFIIHGDRRDPQPHQSDEAAILSIKSDTANDRFFQSEEDIQRHLPHLHHHLQNPPNSQHNLQNPVSSEANENEEEETSQLISYRFVQFLAMQRQIFLRSQLLSKQARPEEFQASLRLIYYYSFLSTFCWSIVIPSMWFYLEKEDVSAGVK